MHTGEHHFSLASGEHHLSLAVQLQLVYQARQCCQLATDVYQRSASHPAADLAAIQLASGGLITQTLTQPGHSHTMARPILACVMLCAIAMLLAASGVLAQAATSNTVLKCNANPCRAINATCSVANPCCLCKNCQQAANGTLSSCNSVPVCSVCTPRSFAPGESCRALCQLSSAERICGSACAAAAVSGDLMPTGSRPLLAFSLPACLAGADPNDRICQVPRASAAGESLEGPMCLIFSSTFDC